MVLCPLRGVPLRTVRRFLDRLGFAAIVRTPEEHDRDVALTQALVHWLGRTLARLPVAEHEVATSGYRKLLEIAGSTSRDSWELFEDLTRENPFAAKVRRRFLEAWAELEEAAMDGLEVVYRASGMIEAEIVKGYLDAQGIPSELEYESAGKVYGLTMDGLGEVRVRVPADFVEEAREALARRPRDFGSTTDVPPTPAA
ncbi:MAG: DUF2007 domain-containing protein [Candidatus Eisenbacteria bacterium]|nr:DUF2007 domain-containing protein [Candidatus Eisenbacteria bacterium]